MQKYSFLWLKDSSMREKHKYDASDFEFLDSIADQYYDGIITDSIDSRADKDCNPNAPLCIGMDYNVNEQDFRWVIIHEFERHHWNVVNVYLGNPMRHDETFAVK